MKIPGWKMAINHDHLTCRKNSDSNIALNVNILSQDTSTEHHLIT